MKADILKELRPSVALLLIKTVDLRKKYEEILIMKYVEDLSYKEISDKLGMEEESVKNLASKARKQFDRYA